MNKTYRVVFALARALTLMSCTVAFRQTLAAMDERPAEIPFKLEDHNIVVDIELNGRHFPFAFDSGLTGGAIVTTAAAKSSGLKAGRGMSVTDAGGERKKAAMTRVGLVKLSGANLKDVLFAITDIPKTVLELPDRTLLAGYIGAPLMNDAVLCIDYEKKAMYRWLRTSFDGPHAGMTAIPMRLNHGLPTITATIDGREATLIVDSGNDGGVVVYESFAERNQFPQRYPNFRPWSANGGSGQTLMAMSGQAGQVDFGTGAIFQNAPMEVIPQGMDPAWAIDGMVGKQLLEQFNPCLDSEGGHFWYKPE